MNTLNRLTLPCFACLVSLSISLPAGAKPKPVGYVVGKLAPELQMVRAQGGTLNLSSLRGSYVVLDLSAMWCDPSERAGAAVRDAVSRLNAKSAIAGDTPVVWVTAEFDGGLQAYSAPPPSSLARFAQKFGIGDALSPVVSFGPFGGQSYQAAWDQLRQYSSANFQPPDPGYPTFIVIDPAGVIVDLFQGFGGTEFGDQSTLNRVEADLQVKNAKYELRPAPYTDLAHLLSALDVTTIIDGVVSSARLPLPGDTAQASSDSQFIVEAGSWYDPRDKTLATTSTYVGISRDGDDLDVESTYRLVLGAVLSPKVPFSGMSQVSGFWEVHVHALSDPTWDDWLRLPITLGADGQIPAFRLADMVDLFQPQIDERFGEPIGVSEIVAQTEWDGPVVSGFGTGKL
jgi:hypothetical protein